MTFFDIETGPLSDTELDARRPTFEARKGLRDPVKIEADLAAKRDGWMDKTTLNAFTSRVWSVAYKAGTDGEVVVDHYGPNPNDSNEAAILECFMGHINSETRLVGFNILTFDVPYLIRRAYALGVHVPSQLRHQKYWRDKFVDLMELWTLGTYRMESQNRISLNNLAKHLGLEGKTGKGSEFWRNMIADQKAAMEYAKRDVELLGEIWDKIG
jgi:uncharacterized protein YprB with RNaseH-like and TPR domain